MDITFLIGNGFDLACNLKTRYTDVYKKYCITDSPNDNIKKFKESILEDNYKNWTDFEMALPKFGKELNDFDNFSECVLDFSKFLEDHLNEEQNKIDIVQNKETLANKMVRYIYHFYEFCLQDSKAVLKRLVEETNGNALCHFITFNYTDTLEKCLSAVKNTIPKQNSTFYKYIKPLHIHGTLYNGILLGLDNEELYQDIPCEDMRKLKNLIDKVHINRRYSDITDRVLQILKQSRIIVILGWSMGESDSYWVASLKKLFSENSNLHLVYVPYYSEATDIRFRNQSLDRENEQKDFITRKFEIPENYRNRVHIITNSEYMNLSFLVKTNNIDKELIAI